MRPQVVINMVSIPQSVASVPLNLPSDQMRRTAIVCAPISLLAELTARVAAPRFRVLEEELIEQLCKTTPRAPLHVISVTLACASRVAACARWYARRESNP